MKWRNQNKNLNRDNQTLDSFLSGVSSHSGNQSLKKSRVIPKIKIPPSSGLEPSTKPLQLPFLYPQYPQFRQYQYSIAIKCVAENTLVCLPTGLGKTHIASVMILNFHQWFPDGLIFFLAPTKPLVDQQSLSLSNFAQYVPPKCVFSLTGSVPAPKRVMAYGKKRIFFCTPQTLENDLLKDRLNPKQIVLLIIDQAHKAIGNYSYANIVRILDSHRFGYRLVALSATPGNDNQRVQEVIENLQIANMIVKSDEDEDVKKYIKRKSIEPIYIKSTAIIREVQQILQQFISWPLNQLLKLRLFDRNLAGGKYGFNSKCFFLINNQVNERASKLPYKLLHLVQSAKCFLKFLADSLSLLREAGYDSFKRKFIYEIDQIDQQGSEKMKIHENFAQIVRQHPKYKRIKELFQGSTNPGSHPKLQKLREILYGFLSSKTSIERKSKVIIFANLRYTCHQIHKYFGQAPYSDVIKSQIFLGQSKTTVESRDGENSTTQTLKLSQKQQISLIKRYKANQINTLISTSIGEQGLDIGEVDAIFCYEGGMSTIRMVQRMGRTGRKRDGSVFVLLMEGKEADQYERANKKTKKMKKANIQKYKYYPYNPTLFEERSEIPIHFFNKPNQEAEQGKSTPEQTEKQQDETKKKIKIASRTDQRNTKKKQSAQQITISEATKSQEKDGSEGEQKANEPVAKQEDLFKIIGHKQTMIKNRPGELDGEQFDQNSEQKIDLTGGEMSVSNYDQDYPLDLYVDSQDSVSIGSTGEEQFQIRRVYEKFDNLFSLDQLYENPLQSEQIKDLGKTKLGQAKFSNLTSKQEERGGEQNQQDQKNQSNQLEEVFKQYRKMRERRIGSDQRNPDNTENWSENSSRIIDQQEERARNQSENDSAY